ATASTITRGHIARDAAHLLASCSLELAAHRHGQYEGDPQRDALSVWPRSADRAHARSAADGLGFLQRVPANQQRPFYQGLQDAPGMLTDDPGQVGVLLHRRVYEAPWSNGEIWSGEVNAQYAIGENRGITIEVDRSARFLNREIVFMISER